MVAKRRERKTKTARCSCRAVMAIAIYYLLYKLGVEVLKQFVIEEDWVLYRGVEFGPGA